MLCIHDAPSVYGTVLWAKVHTVLVKEEGILSVPRSVALCIHVKIALQTMLFSFYSPLRTAYRFFFPVFLVL